MMPLWDRICIHACYRDWNPVGLILNDDWVMQVRDTYGRDYPGWSAVK